MGSNSDFMRSYLERAWANPPASLAEEASKTLADNFQSFDENGDVRMDKQTTIGMGQMMSAAFTDFKWVYRDIQEAENGAVVTGHFEGIHTGDFDLSALGAGVFPASGKKVVWPEVTLKWRIEDGKIVSSEPIAGDSGLEAFIGAITAA